MVMLAEQYAFSFHSHWMTDYVGHRGPFDSGVQLLELLDGVLEGVLANWNDEQGLVILTSDHGNMEHIGDRKHTENKVPTVVIGSGKEIFAKQMTSLLDLVPLMGKYLFD
jgi:bisphosphoglycerate-independent phosphoglycerate mutase (AlkP superfamily)